MHGDSASTTAKAIFVLGPPGTGKSTLVHHLSTRLGYSSFLSGHALREAAKRSAHPLREEISTRLKNNQPMPIDLYCRVIGAEIDGKGTTGLIVDGYPRNCEQCIAIPCVLNAVGMPDAQVVGLVLHTPPDVLRTRIASRAICASCGTDSQTLPGCCENPKLVRRSDDSSDIIAHRLSEYQAISTSIVSTFAQNWRILTIDANATIDKVVNCAVAALAIV